MFIIKKKKCMLNTIQSLWEKKRISDITQNLPELATLVKISNGTQALPLKKLKKRDSAKKERHLIINLKTISPLAKLYSIY